jgi:N-acetyl-gamma-glutamyl-phosphate reductase
MQRDINVAILGASGYTGAELLRLLAGHPRFRIAALTADRNAGEEMVDVYAHTLPQNLPTLTKIEDVDWSDIQAVFCCLPHGTTQEVIAGLPTHLKIVDLSADFRLYDLPTYDKWYGHPHRAPQLQPEAVYGLTEHARTAVANARLVANPGCYPTCTALPLLPLLTQGLIEPDGIIVDAKSGVTGAGRSLRQDLLFSEVHDGFHAYGVGKHRHQPEIEQTLSLALDGREMHVVFTPHLIPINRGMMCTTYIRPKGGATADDLRAALNAAYADERFVHVTPAGKWPATREVRGSNYCFMGVGEAGVPGQLVVISVIDNLVKGASGQALQNMNLLFGLEEAAGLLLEPLYP